MTQSRVQSKSGRKRSPFRRFMRTLLIMFVLMFAASGAVVAYMANQVNDVTSSASVELERGDRSENRTEPVSPSKDNISILFLGVDDRDGNLDGRTDANLLATFNRDEGSVKVLSIPRDTLVDIPGRGEDKINHAHAFGGVDLTIDTVEQMLDIPVDYFVTINFTAFMEIVDTLGGIEVDSPIAFTEMDSADTQNAISIDEGIQELDGEEALAYARMRKSDPRGDIGRGERQQQVLEAMLRKGMSFNSIVRFDDVMESLERHVKMNLSFGEIVGMHGYASSLNEVESINFRGNDATYSGVYYFQVEDQSLEEVSTELRVHLGLEEPEVTDDSEAEDDETEE
ncbi:LCP family protein [Paenalkalicoccus suaedae]|uniref:LCP family protein n=1 Tax=Paenalkalicoccus suaedae TaxID=2592382 RepID=A0A859FGX9_9BACI|nr:LCP family protein [Paenalkalicoccus suaedae]QKS72379.1 LCP family protein [Paenalkalicoccus suaedae]